MKGITLVFFCVFSVALGAAPAGLLELTSSELRLVQNGFDEVRVARSLREATGSNTYLTSAARSPWDQQRLLVSTTFHGIFESEDDGETWNALGRGNGLRTIYKGNGFYDDIARVAYDASDRNILWLHRAQSGDLVAIDRRRGAVVNLPSSRGERALEAAVIAGDQPLARLYPAREERMARAADKVSFFLAPWHVGPDSLPGHMEFAREQGFNAVVIDFKDDNGRIAYETSLELPRQVGAVRRFFDAQRVIRTVHENDLYLIARIVVFKDEQLYRYQNNRYALWDSRRNAPWGVFRQETTDDGETRSRQVEYWVDPFSEFVWDYNIAIARELQEMGVDEIQFDYIRTPADGRRQDIVYRYKEDSPALNRGIDYGDPRVQALTEFARRAREQISIPISIDVFGFNGWYRMSYLGQDIAALAQYVDVISPMLYPSHFPRAFMGDMPYLEWAEYLYEEGTARGRRITGDTVLIRPYIQSFLIGGELRFDEDTYTEYLKRQIRGSLAAGASGFTLWNFSGRYYMVSRGLWFDDDERSAPR
ncbi:hypothetical protein AU468_08105 [Alkalispirochaeta sphaeroplastigenens]|uniref:DUF4015 domain-containing protein n=1 Tax=Alkalispirochaeta sphaeroplastigenens TaxID=1187066 RepID=A0A2S4JPT1_9SPIO|nr:putative glycoside hydrolase [Alkalispirochaeta sphaeroplastigenens]POR01515.1 hypothetical protein AU468_08105 [Alkalispirochaeta sphaeroplastigenens]